MKSEAEPKVPEPVEPVPVKTESSAGANGSAAAPAEEVKVVGLFEDSRWVNGTWDLKQFEKSGKTDWDAVIDAGMGSGYLFFWSLILNAFLFV